MIDNEIDLRCNAFDGLLPEPTSDRHKLKNAIFGDLVSKRYLMRV